MDHSAIRHHMRHAYRAARLLSEDNNTQVGAVVPDAWTLPLVGANRFSSPGQNTPENLERSRKYPRIVHAEMDIIFTAAASKISLVANNRIATVISSHRFATKLGYEHATVVVAQNPEMPVDFRDPSQGKYNKFTVCRYNAHTPCNLPAALIELQALENGWGGRGDIFGSPQGVSSTLTLDQVVKVVSKHLK